MREIHYTPDMVCPYCGNDEFYIKECYQGRCQHNMRFDLSEDDVENGEMYEYAYHTTIGEYTYCNKCKKRLFKISELPEDYR